MPTLDTTAVIRMARSQSYNEVSDYKKRKYRLSVLLHLHARLSYFYLLSSSICEIEPWLLSCRFNCFMTNGIPEQQLLNFLLSMIYTHLSQIL